VRQQTTSALVSISCHPEASHAIDTPGIQFLWEFRFRRFGSSSTYLMVAIATALNNHVGTPAEPDGPTQQLIAEAKMKKPAAARIDVKTLK